MYCTGVNFGSTIDINSSVCEILLVPDNAGIVINQTGYFHYSIRDVFQNSSKFVYLHIHLFLLIENDSICSTYINPVIPVYAYNSYSWGIVE